MNHFFFFTCSDIYIINCLANLYLFVQSKDDISNCLLQYFHRLLENKLEMQAEEILLEKFANFCAHSSIKVLMIISDLSHGKIEINVNEDEVSW
jgi:hypothetical protein